MIDLIESYRCPGCDAAVAREAVTKELSTDIASGEQLQCVRLWCECCNRAWAGDFRLRNGILEMIDRPRLLRTIARRALMKEIGKLRGDVQAA